MHEFLEPTLLNSFGRQTFSLESPGWQTCLLYFCYSQSSVYSMNLVQTDDREKGCRTDSLRLQLQSCKFQLRPIVSWHLVSYKGFSQSYLEQHSLDSFGELIWDSPIAFIRKNILCLDFQWSLIWMKHQNIALQSEKKGKYSIRNNLKLSLFVLLECQTRHFCLFSKHHHAGIKSV